MTEHILAVQRMQDYIAAHLTEEITMADLARTSLFSPWHSYRLFRQYLGMTPADYIRRLRLSRSALRLKQGDYRVTDAAFDTGFDSIEGYQRAFQRAFGCNPGEYLRTHPPIPLFIPYGVRSQELRKEKHTVQNLQTVFVQLIHKPARRCVIKRGKTAAHYFEYCEEVGCDVWGLLMSMDSLCGEPVCLWLPQQYRPSGTSEYVQGVEVPADGEIVVPDGFDVIELPAAEYLMFQGEPFAEEEYSAAIEGVWEAMKRYDPARIGYVWDDANPRIQLSPMGERGYIELRAVMPLTDI